MRHFDLRIKDERNRVDVLFPELIPFHFIDIPIFSCVCGKMCKQISLLRHHRRLIVSVSILGVKTICYIDIMILSFKYLKKSVLVHRRLTVNVSLLKKPLYL
jgi:hypothetical protein